MLNKMKFRILSGKKLIFILFIVIMLNLFSAEFIVKDFKEQPNDIELQRNPVRDVNREYAALIKISTDLIPFSFQTNIGVVQTEKKVGEFWAYVPSGTTYLIFTKQGFNKLRFAVPVTVKSNTVYTMTLGSKGYGMGIADEDLVQITFNLNESDVYISKDNSAPIQKKEKLIVYKVPKGEHKFKFFKQDFNEIIKTWDFQKDESIQITLERGQTTTRMKLPGFIDISSEPAGAEIFIDDQKMGVTPIYIELTAGEHKLTLRKSFYYTYNGTFELAERETKTLPKIDMKPKFGYYEVTSNPSGANFYLDNKLLGKTPVNRKKIESGTHLLKIEYELYHPEEKDFVINDGDDEKFEFDLKPAFGELILNSQPESGADVYIDENLMGTTPFSNKKMPSGNYLIRIEKELWMGAEESITIYDGQKIEKTLLLTRNFAELKVIANNSRIFLDDEYVADNAFSKKLNKGKYRLKATRDKHNTAEREIFITPGNDLEIELKPTPKVGSLSITSNPYESKGAEIHLNDLKQKETTPAVIPLLIGNYNVTIKHPKFLEQTKPVVINENEQIKLDFDLVTYEGSMLS
ncbi:MAG TPA: PEGA domain-containing protein, partial [Candidatus Cloacimonetes bacterium]|nr:PEGA domain-containing protein [Candidatus Cloacimonadota bacterium]